MPRWWTVVSSVVQGREYHIGCINIKKPMCRRSVILPFHDELKLKEYHCYHKPIIEEVWWSRYRACWCNILRLFLLNLFHYHLLKRQHCKSYWDQRITEYENKPQLRAGCNQWQVRSYADGIYFFKAVISVPSGKQSLNVFDNFSDENASSLGYVLNFVLQSSCAKRLDPIIDFS